MDNREREIAIREAEEIHAENEYFEARPHLDSETSRAMICAGFNRAWVAAHDKPKIPTMQAFAPMEEMAKLRADLAAATLRADAAQEELRKAREQTSRYYHMSEEEWVYLAIELCEEEGHDPHELIYDGGYPPEPWGEKFYKYEEEAKRMIALVRKHTAPVPAQPQPAPEGMALAFGFLWHIAIDFGCPVPQGFSRNIDAGYAVRKAKQAMRPNLTQADIADGITRAANIIDSENGNGT